MTATATSSNSTSNLSPGKQPLTGQQLGAILNSADYGAWKNNPTPAVDMALLYASMDSIASIASTGSGADFWKSRDLAAIFASSDAVKMPKMPPLSAAAERYRSIGAAVELMSVTNPKVPQSLFADMYASRDSVFASIDPLPFQSLDSVMSKAGVLPEARMPDGKWCESGDWLPGYVEGHMEIPYTPELFKSSDTATPTAPTKPRTSSKWEAVYKDGLRPPTGRAITPTPAPKPTPKKTTPKKKPPSKRGDPKEKVYVKPRELDIISGRGGKSNSWPGNERYRETIEEAKPAYKEGEKYQKTIMSQTVVDQMVKEGRRFLKLEDSGPHKGEYYVMTKNQARKKAGQALREENTPESRKKKRDFYAKKKEQ